MPSKRATKATTIEATGALVHAEREPGGSAVGPSDATAQASPEPPTRPAPAAEPPGSRPPWTPAQLLGIETTGKSLLVSAAAGSGKTSVLAARCTYLVCDATPPCDVDELLVVTFTEAAAAEMKARIHKSLSDRLTASDNPHLARQLELIDSAQVSTLHGFCARLLRQHFHLLGLDPNFTILDGDEASLLRYEVCRELFAKRYEDDVDGTFQSFVDAYGDGNDERLVDRVIRTHELLQSVLDPDLWMRDPRRRLDEPLDGPFEQSALGRELVQHLSEQLAALLATARESYAAIKRDGGFPKYLEQLEELGKVVRMWNDVLHADGIDALIEVAADLQIPKLPPVPNSVPGKDQAKARMEAVREPLKKGPIVDSLRFTTGQWREGLRAIRPHAEVFLSLVESFGERYRTAKDEVRSIDFSDLERYALNVLRIEGVRKLEPSPVARLLHREFRHVLVDEYQDINEVQDAILSLVSTEIACGDGRDSAAPPANLFCVGDVKQSIYRFRLAEPARFLERESRFRGQPITGTGTVIDLQSNFRSRKPLLDAINGVFARLMTRAATDIEYDHSHYLHGELPYPEANGVACFTGSPIELHLLPAKLDTSSDDAGDGDDAPGGPDENTADRTAREAFFVARRIREMMGADGAPNGASQPMCVMEKHADGSLVPRPMRYSDVVILLRSLKFKADQYADVLRTAGIPVHSESGTGYFETTEVRDVLALLSVLDNQRQDVPLAALLRSPIANLPRPEDSLARIRLAYPAGGSGGGEGAVPFHRAVVRYATEQDDELAARLREFLRDLGKWRQLAQRRPLAELIWTIYDATGYLAFVGGLPDGEQRSANLLYLHERARQFGSFHRQGLSRFIAFLDQLRAEADLGKPAVASAADDVVRIMSVHGSKGLEFPVVFLPDLGKTINLSDCRGSILVDRRAGLGLAVVDEPKRVRYPSVASTLVAARLRQQSLAEELRVLYVAMTRAKEHLVLVGTTGETAVDQWRSRWGSHSGPLPADAILGARTMLDWIGPVAAAMQGAGKIEIEFIPHASDEVAAWPDPQQLRPQVTARQAAMSRLLPLDPPPPPDDAADAIVRRLTTPYPHQPFTTLPAAVSVSALTTEGRIAPGGVPFSRTLPIPRAVSTELAPSATDVGSATHLVLQHLDFTRPCDAADLKAQVSELIDRRLLSPALETIVDLEGVAWLTASAVGQMLRRHAHRMRRELPVYFPLPPDAPGTRGDASGLDRVMARGRVDVLVETEAGLEVIDYKTDRVTAGTVAARAEFYEPQLALYRQAVEAVTGRAVAHVHLVFLAPRVIRSA